MTVPLAMHLAWPRGGHCGRYPVHYPCGVLPRKSSNINSLLDKNLDLIMCLYNVC
jgi:hypothetical protein